MEQTLALSKHGDELLIDSRLVAEELGLQHESFMAAVYKHKMAIEDICGALRFEIGPKLNKNSGGDQPKIVLLTEDQALYIGTLSKNTEAAVKFKGRVVLAYSKARRQLQSQSLSTELTRKQILSLALEAEEALEKANAIIAEQAPQVALAQKVIEATNLQTVAHVAKEFGMGRQRMFKFLRDQKILLSDNTPLQRYIDAQYFEVRLKPIAMGGNQMNYAQTFVTGKGIAYIHKLIENQKEEF